MNGEHPKNEAVTSKTVALPTREEVRRAIARETADYSPLELFIYNWEPESSERWRPQLAEVIAAAQSPSETKHAQAPIALLTVSQGGELAGVTMYAPGLPPGDHDLYCEPEASAPYIRQVCPACGHHDRYHFDDGHGNVICRWGEDCECIHRAESAEKVSDGFPTCGKPMPNGKGARVCVNPPGHEGDCDDMPF